MRDGGWPRSPGHHGVRRRTAGHQQYDHFHQHDHHQRQDHDDDRQVVFDGEPDEGVTDGLTGCYKVSINQLFWCLMSTNYFRGFYQPIILVVSINQLF